MLPPSSTAFSPMSTDTDRDVTKTGSRFSSVETPSMRERKKMPLSPVAICTSSWTWMWSAKTSR